MCAIFAYIKLLKYKNVDNSKLFQDFWNLKPRGPDNSYLENYGDVWIGFHRLAILDTSFKSNQPFVFQEKDRTVIFICNGEIYNFRELIEKYDLPINTNSDCMTIPELYLKYTRNEGDVKDFFDLFQNNIKGEFAFVMFEFDRLKNLKKIFASRDQIGIRPLYTNTTITDELIFSSEVKGINSYDGEIEEFPPGCITLYNFDDLGKQVDKTIYTFKNVYVQDNFTSSEEYHLHLQNASRSASQGL